MSNYSTKALTREEALKLKALGESYDVTPMSIKEAIIAGAPNSQPEPTPDPGPTPKSAEKTFTKSSKKSADKDMDLFDKALTNDERLDYYRNSNSGSGGSGEIADLFKTITISFSVSEGLAAQLEETPGNTIELQLGIPTIYIPQDPLPVEDDGSTNVKSKSIKYINSILYTLSEGIMLSANNPVTTTAYCPVDGAVAILMNDGYLEYVSFIEATGSVIDEVQPNMVVAYGDCEIVVGLPEEQVNDSGGSSGGSPNVL